MIKAKLILQGQILFLSTNDKTVEVIWAGISKDYWLNVRMTIEEVGLDKDEVLTDIYTDF